MKTTKSQEHFSFLFLYIAKPNFEYHYEMQHTIEWDYIEFLDCNFMYICIMGFHNRLFYTKFWLYSLYDLPWQ